MNVSSFQPNEMTSTKKGESRLDTLHTLANYIDLQVIRTESSSLVDQTLELYQNYNVSTRLINAGSHQIEHPTQALLDILTILEHCEKNQRNLGEMKFLIVGDIERGRAAKSFLQIIKQYGATKIDICEHSNQTENLSSNQHKFREFSSQADYIYMTRVQNEYGGDPSAQYVLDQNILDSMNQECGVLHPLPRREELPILVDQDPRALYWRQEEIGFLSRMILAANLLEINLI